MRSVNIAELKDRLSAYVAVAKAGEVVVIRDRNVPVAKLMPFAPEDALEEDLAMVAAGAMRVPEKAFDLEAFSKMPPARVRRGSGLQALLDERAEGR